MHRSFCNAAPSQAHEERVRPPEALSQELDAGARGGGVDFEVGFRAQVNPKP